MHAGTKRRSYQELEFPQSAKRFKSSHSNEELSQRAMSQILYNDQQEVELEFNKCLSLYSMAPRTAYKSSLKQKTMTMSQPISGNNNNKNKNMKRMKRINRKNNPWDRKMIDFLQRLTLLNEYNAFEDWIRSSLAINVSVKIYEERVDNLNQSVLKLLSTIIRTQTPQTTNQETQTTQTKRKRKRNISSNNTNININVDGHGRYAYNNILNKYEMNRFNIIRQKSNLILLSNEWWCSKDKCTPWPSSNNNNNNNNNNKKKDFCQMLLSENNINGFNFDATNFAELHVFNSCVSNFFHKTCTSASIAVSAPSPSPVFTLNPNQSINDYDINVNIPSPSPLPVPLPLPSPLIIDNRIETETENKAKKSKKKNVKKSKKRKKRSIRSIIRHVHNGNKSVAKKRKYNKENEMELFRANDSENDDNLEQDYNFNLDYNVSSPYPALIITPPRSISTVQLMTPLTPQTPQTMNLLPQLIEIIDDNLLLQTIETSTRTKTRKKTRRMRDVFNGSNVSKLNNFTFSALEDNMTFVQLLQIQLLQYPNLTIPMGFLSLLTVSSDSYYKHNKRTNTNQSHIRINLERRKFTAAHLNDFFICIANRSES